MANDTIVAVKTRQFRTFFEALTKEYGPRIIVQIDGTKYTSDDHAWLILNWCNRKHLRRTINFSVSLEGEVIFAFHDGPENLWASPSQMDFLARLQKQNVVKYRLYHRPVGFFQKVMSYFKRRRAVRRTAG